MSNRKNYSVLISFLFSVGLSQSFAQGPRLSYLYNAATELSWASCYVYLDGGSKQRVPFMPVINPKRAPCGTNKYSMDINIRAPIVFVGNGIVEENKQDCYRDVDVAGKIVMFCHDFPDTINGLLEREISKEERIDDAVAMDVAGIILFSFKEEYPLYRYEATDIEHIPEIPIISVTKEATKNILASAGENAEEIFREWQKSGQFKSRELICKLHLVIKGRFDKIETGNFLFSFRKELIAEDKMKSLVQVNERSVEFIVDLFKSGHLAWRKSFTAYFRDYDSKLFYTGHWGKGLSSEAGTFIVYDGSIPDFGLAVHENTHTLVHLNWSGSSSFMNEGIAKYAEAMATNRDQNDLETIEFLKEGNLIQLGKMILMNIGLDQGTEIAYPASGSFIGYLVRTYGLDDLRAAFRLEGRKQEDKEEESTWVQTYQETLDSLEKDWIRWLAKRHHVEQEYIDAFLTKRSPN